MRAMTCPPPGSCRQTSPVRSGRGVCAPQPFGLNRRIPDDMGSITRTIRQRSSACARPPRGPGGRTGSASHIGSEGTPEGASGAGVRTRGATANPHRHTPTGLQGTIRINPRKIGRGGGGRLKTAAEKLSGGVGSPWVGLWQQSQP